mmetsp:Transcript_15739/g.46533  ORF Transcript_15739/g.46533 Transcript_15739/m.46533 type:complete len:83 (+) Transcript_15739:487-735(+)
MAHIMAVFGAATARPPVGLHPDLPLHHDATDEEAEATAHGLLQQAFGANYELVRHWHARGRGTPHLPYSCMACMWLTHAAPT